MWPIPRHKLQARLVFNPVEDGKVTSAAATSELSPLAAAGTSISDICGDDVMSSAEVSSIADMCPKVFPVPMAGAASSLCMTDAP